MVYSVYAYEIPESSRVSTGMAINQVLTGIQRTNSIAFMFAITEQDLPEHKVTILKLNFKLNEITG